MVYVGIILVLFSFLQTYNVLFNSSSKEYYKAEFKGEKFKSGCVVPILLFFVGIIILSLNSEYEKAQERENRKQNPKNEEKAIKFSDEYKKLVHNSIPEFKKYISSNYKKMLRDNQEIPYIKMLINAEKNKLTKENNQLRQEISVIKKLEIPTKEKKKKISSIATVGRSNEKKLKELQEKIKYLDDVFLPKKGK